MKHTAEQIARAEEFLRNHLHDFQTVYTKAIMTSPSQNNWSWKHFELFIIFGQEPELIDITRPVARLLDRTLDKNDLIKCSQQPFEVVQWLGDKLGKHLSHVALREFF